MYRNRLEDAALNIGAKVIPNLASRIFGSDDIQQLGVKYPKSSLSEDHLKARQLLASDVPEAGDRAPDAQVIEATGKTTSLFAEIYNLNGFDLGVELAGL